jgi:hypothetical protein
MPNACLSSHSTTPILPLPNSFSPNDCNLLVELKFGLVIDRLHKRNCGKQTGIEQISVERPRMKMTTDEKGTRGEWSI